jgi:hypothetical protein
MNLLEEDVTMEDDTPSGIDGMVSLIGGTARKMREGETLYPGNKPPDSTTMPHMEDAEETTGTASHDPG